MSSQSISVDIGKHFRITMELDESNPVPTVLCSIYSPISSNTCLKNYCVDALHPLARVELVKCDYTLKGEITMVLKEESLYERVILTGNFFVGEVEDEKNLFHWSGTLAYFNSYILPEPVPGPTPSCPVPPVPEPPVPEPLNLEEEGEESPVLDTTVFSNLFPYLDLINWPEPPKDPVNFIDISIDAPAPNSLYASLKTNHKKKDAQQMMQDCDAFLEDKSSFETIKYACASEVPPPFNYFPELYDEIICSTHSGEGLIEVLNTALPVEMEAFVSAPKYTQIKRTVAQNYIALNIIQGYKKELAIAFYKMLIIHHLLEYFVIESADGKRIQNLLFATIVLPKEIFPLPYDPVPTKDVVLPYAIGKLQMTKYRHIDYSLGDISHIENLMQGEVKKLHLREFNRSKTEELESATSEENEQLLNEGGTESLINEVKKTIGEYTKSKEYDNFQTSYGPPTIDTLDGKIITKHSYINPDLMAKNQFAKKILDKTLNQIKRKISSKRSSQIVREFEERSTRVLDNSKGISSTRGVYYWLNKNFEIKVENYGQRLLIEICLNNPAKNFIHSDKELNGVSLDRKMSLEEKEIFSYKNIERENFDELIRYYEVEDVILPPNELTHVFTSISSEETHTQIIPPDGYQANKAKINALFFSPETINEVDVIIADNTVKISNGTTDKFVTLSELTSSFPFATTNPIPTQSLPKVVNTVLVSVRITCELTERALNEWKIKVFHQLTLAYKEWLKKYDASLTRLSRDDEGTNGLLLRNIERSSIRKDIETLLYDHKFALTINEEAFIVNKPAYMQFFNSSIEWEEMNYVFNDSPPNLTYALQGENDSLRPFLQAKTARILLPIIPEYNYQFINYLGTGLIWTTYWPFLPVLEKDIGIIDHFKKEKESKEEVVTPEAWEITVPTSMQVIEGDGEIKLNIKK
ncbi:MAG: hypothetical protein HRT58_14645 [Crocinitomicaceae bacterium]|nr:hypothetical protein [Flavobacteriales bacterium]NQZ36906.1 hypothetical protein [Crocinitomicaceae bacterium]